MSDRAPDSMPPDGSRNFTLIAAAIMVLLALLGVGLATTNLRVARLYWMSLVPVYGVLCTVTAWRRAPRAGASGSLVLREVLHWLGIGAAVALDFYIRGTGVETQASSGLNALLLLALGCYLAGIHLDWPFAGVGLLLTLTLICVAKAEQYLWLIFVAGVLVLAGFVAVRRMLGSARARSPG